MKKLSALFISIALLALLAGCPPTPAPVVDQVTGVTISGTGVTGTGESKEVTVAIGTPLLLTATPTYTGTPDLTPAWASADAATVAVTANGEVNGLVFTSTGVVVTVTIGGVSDTVLVKVINAVAGLTLEFDRDKLEFQTVPTTIYANAAATGTPPTVVRSAANVITLTNTDGSLKDSSTVTPPVPLGSSYLLLQTPFAAGKNFEAKAAIKLTSAVASSDRYMVGIGMVTTDANGLVTVDPDINVLTDSQLAMTAKRSHSSTPGVRSFYHKNNATIIGASDPTVDMTPTALAEYHILSIKRVGTNITFSCNGGENTVPIINPWDGSTLGARFGLAGAVKVGLMWAGVTADVEGFTISSLDDSGLNPVVLYTSGTMPTVPIEVYSIDTTGPTGSEQTATIDLVGISGGGTTTLQLATSFMPTYAAIGNTVAYTVSADDTNVTVDTNGLVTISYPATPLTYDWTATITGTSGNGKIDTYVIKLINSSLVVTGVDIPAAMTILAKQSKSISPITISPGGAYNPALTWSSSNPLFTVTNGIVTAAASVTVGTTATITATSVQVGTISDTCIVTVIAGSYFSFPTENWGTSATGHSPAMLTASATTAGSTVTFTVNLNSGTPVLYTIDGLTYKNTSTGVMRFKYSGTTDPNAINYNGGSTANGSTLPAVGSTLPGGDADLTRSYVSFPLSSISTTNVNLTARVRFTNTTAGVTANLIGVSGTTYTVLSTVTQPATGASTVVFPLTYSGALSGMTSVIVAATRPASSGGLDIWDMEMIGY